MPASYIVVVLLSATIREILSELQLVVPVHLFSFWVTLYFHSDAHTGWRMHRDLHIIVSFEFSLHGFLSVSLLRLCLIGAVNHIKAINSVNHDINVGLETLTPWTCHPSPVAIIPTDGGVLDHCLECFIFVGTARYHILALLLECCSLQ